MSIQKTNEQSASVDNDDIPEVLAINKRNATVLFLIYLVFYAAFVLLAAYWPKSMSVKVLAGVNLAIIFGMGLIFAAVALAIIYMWLCARTMENFKAAGGKLSLNPSPTTSEIKAKPSSEREGGQA